MEDLISNEAGGYSFEGFCFRRRRAWGAPLPYTPSGDGCERGMTLSRSPGDELEGSLVSDGARDLLFDGTGAILLMAFASGDAGVGRSAPLHPLGDGVREGYDPLALSRRWVGGKFSF